MMNPPIPAEAISMDSQPPVPYRATGPRTAAGKAIVARNAVSHGIFAANPVVPGLDRAEEWEAHRATLLASLAPEDDFQLALAERAALLFWRLRRVACYETETTAAALEAVEDDVPRHHQGSAGYLGVGGRPQDFRDRVAECRRTFQLLHDLPALPAGQPLSGDDVEALLVAALDEQEEDVSPEQFAYPGIPKDLDVAAFDGWTVALARDALRVIAEKTKSRPDALLDTARAAAARLLDAAQQALDRAEATARRLRGERTLPPPEATDRVVRYEAHLHRLLVSTLHELEAAQARHRGHPAPLARLDLAGASPDA